METITLSLIDIDIRILPNNVGYKHTRIDDDDYEDGYYYKKESYILDKPNLIVNAQLDCNNHFFCGDKYLDNNGVEWIAIRPHTLVNKEVYMDMFMTPKEMTLIQPCGLVGSGMPRTLK